MTEQEACTIMAQQFPELELQTVTDYNNYFVFTYRRCNAPVGVPEVDDPIAVEKTTEKTLSFHPLRNNPKAYFKAVRENNHPVIRSTYDKKVESGKEAVAHSLLKSR